MSTLKEIEQAVGALPAVEKEELLFFLATQLRAERRAELPEPRLFSKEEIDGWIAEDEADAARFRAGQ